ncbi:MAG: DUF3703 domain-containing protein [Hyphomonadaceae bacterium]|nr:DUF3703 domain-containing protein [Hyphomonadaceae bacterium]
MEIAIGAALAIGVCGLGVIAGFERDRAVYPVMLIVIASYYDLFAVMGGDRGVLGMEIAISLGFAALAVLGFRVNLWLTVVGLLGHAGLDFFHAHVVTNPGLPSWWPGFCATFDAVAGLYLLWALAFKRIDASDPLSFGIRIRAYVDAEFTASQTAERAGDTTAAFQHLERAHILGQRSTVQHVRVHMRMLWWGIRNHKAREVVGQFTRVIGAATKTWIGLIPSGNTGGANVSPFKPMTISDDLAELIDVARSPRLWLN